MARNEKRSRGEPEREGLGQKEGISYGEAARSREPGRKAGVIDSEEAARQESRAEESLPPMATDEEKIAKRQGKAGPGDTTDHMSEEERHGGIPDDEANH